MVVSALGSPNPVKALASIVIGCLNPKMLEGLEAIAPAAAILFRNLEVASCGASSSSTSSCSLPKLFNFKLIPISLGSFVASPTPFTSAGACKNPKDWSNWPPC